MCLYWISLTMVTLWAECYCGTLSLRQPFFAKGLSYFATLLSFCVRMPGVIHPTGCTSDSLWVSPSLVLGVLYLTESLRSTWLASDCNRCWCEASYHLLATDTQQQCLNLEYKPWYHCGANAKMIVVTTVMSDVNHLLHVFHVLIITFRHESVCYLIFWKFFVHTLQSELVSS